MRTTLFIVIYTAGFMATTAGYYVWAIADIRKMRGGFVHLRRMEESDYVFSLCWSALCGLLWPFMAPLGLLALIMRTIARRLYWRMEGR